MNIEQIIFNIMKSNAHTWVRYWLSKEVSVTLPGEYVEIRSSYLSYISLTSKHCRRQGNWNTSARCVIDEVQ